MSEDKRWIVQIDWLTANGIVTVDHHVEELEEISDLVERGPDWNAMKQLRVELNPLRKSYDATVEETVR